MVGGNTLLRNFRKQYGMKWVSDENTLSDLADNISQLYRDVKQEDVRFLRPGPGPKTGRMYPSRALQIRRMKRAYGLETE